MLEVWAKHKERVEKHKKIKVSGQAIELSLGERKEVKVQKLEGEKRLLEPS